MRTDHWFGQFSPGQFVAVGLFFVEQGLECRVRFIFCLCHLLPRAVVQLKLHFGTRHGVERVGSEFGCCGGVECHDFGSRNPDLFIVITASGFVVEQVIDAVEVHDRVAVGSSIGAHGVWDTRFIRLA